MKNLIISVFILTTGAIFSQTQEIDSICNDYDKKIAEAKEMEDLYVIPRIQINSPLMKRAIGPVDHLITIYYDEYEVEIGQEGMDVFHKEAVIRKAEFKMESVSYEINFSFYFDEGGLLIRYDEIETGYRCVEYRAYFQNKEAIRIIQKPFPGAVCELTEEIDTYDKTELTKKEKAEVSWIQNTANKFREILFLNYELIKG